MLRHLFGYEKKRIGNTSFRVMSALLRIRDLFAPVETKVRSWGIKQGDTVVDFGCGPGSYIPIVSMLVGSAGRVYAVDVHELAIEEIEKKRLTNVVPVLAASYPTEVPGDVADLVYAMDMFHMVKDTKSFLHELWRITKPSGLLLIESGHQPERLAFQNLNESGLWTVERETGSAFSCRPRRK